MIRPHAQEALSMLSHALPAALETSAAGRWFVERLVANDIEVVEDDELEEPAAADRDSRTIWVPSGRDFQYVHTWACRGALFINTGARLTWGFSPRPPPVTAGGVVIPFPTPVREVG